MPDPILFSWGPFTIRWYGVLIGLGMMLGVILALRETRRKGLNEDHLLNMCLVALPLAIVGCRAYYVLFNWGYYSANPAKIFAIWEGGLAIHGGIIAGGLAFALMAKRYRFGIGQILDIAAPSVILGQAIGRWGNFFNQEAYGYVVDPEKIPWAMYIDGAWRHPTFLYESIWDLGVFVFLLWFRRRKGLKTGDVCLMYFILYSAGRFWVEGLRTDSLMLFGQLRAAQVLSLALIIASAVILFIRHRKTTAADSEAGTAAEEDVYKRQVRHFRLSGLWAGPGGD